jgi:hypothetical protein
MEKRYNPCFLFAKCSKKIFLLQKTKEKRKERKSTFNFPISSTLIQQVYKPIIVMNRVLIIMNNSCELSQIPYKLHEKNKCTHFLFQLVLNL